MRYLADTNILLRGAEPAHPMHSDAEEAVKRLLAQGEEVCVFPQNLMEFWSVATRAADKNGLGFTPKQTETEVIRIESIFMVIADTAAIYPEWKRLVISYSILGKQVHDARIVAAMNVHGIKNLLTFNADDFKRFSGITVVDPRTVT